MTRSAPSTALRVLLVEDDPGDVFLVRELLAEIDPTIRLAVAGSLAEVDDGQLLPGRDCVLLDLNLPAAQGLDGLRAVLLADPTAAVCVLTGLDDEHLGIAAVAAGAQDYLVKGKVDSQLLIRSIRYAVERRRAETSLVRLREEQLAAAESARLERGLLPSPLLGDAPVRARTFYRAGRARSIIGGDFFDVVRGPSGIVHAIVGDVCGHGPDEAALGAQLRVAWRALVLAGVPDEQLLPYLQQVLLTERHDDLLFTTVCQVAIRLPEPGRPGELAVRLAGHPAPISLVGEPRPITPPIGLPLGVSADAVWRPLRERLDPEWALLLYTDGLVEGRVPEPGQRLWEEGLLELLDQERATDLEQLPARLVARVQELNDGPLVDDTAILLLSSERVGR